MEEGRAIGMRPRTDPTPQDKDTHDFVGQWDRALPDKTRTPTRQGHPRLREDKTRTPTTSSGNGTGHSSIRTLNAVPVSDHGGETLQRSGQRYVGIFPNFGCPGLHAGLHVSDFMCRLSFLFAHGTFLRRGFIASSVQTVSCPRPVSARPVGTPVRRRRCPCPEVARPSAVARSASRCPRAGSK
jgi:hypothetical protein